MSEETMPPGWHQTPRGWEREAPGFTYLVYEREGYWFGEAEPADGGNVWLCIRHQPTAAEAARLTEEVVAWKLAETTAVGLPADTVEAALERLAACRAGSWGCVTLTFSGGPGAWQVRAEDGLTGADIGFGRGATVAEAVINAAPAAAAKPPEGA